ncbi:MAG TPA: hypothetical protein DCF42_04710, partial [Lachnospiraceae bacterium]|nr:hypothetical protein [Lachnospiraceae bacterium]
VISGSASASDGVSLLIIKGKEGKKQIFFQNHPENRGNTPCEYPKYVYNIYVCVFTFSQREKGVIHE